MSKAAKKTTSSASTQPQSFFKETQSALSSIMLREISYALGYLLAYWSLDWLSFIYISDDLSITPWNPPVAASILLLLLGGFSRAPLLFVAALSYQVLFEKSNAPFSVMLSTSMCEALVYTTAVWLLLHKFKINKYLSSLRDVLIFSAVILSAAACMGISYVLTYYAANLVTLNETYPLIFKYWASDSLGILILTPFCIINWPRLRRFSLKNRFSRDAVAQTCFTVLLALFIFFMEKNKVHMFYLFFIPVVWAAVSNGLIRATWIILILQLTIIFACLELQIAAPITLTFLPFIMLVITCMSLILGSVIDEKERVKLSNLKNDARLRALLDMAPDCMMIVDMQGHVVAANKNLMRLLGNNNLSSVVNQNIKNIIPTFYPELNGETFLLNSDNVDIPIEITSSKVPVGDKYSSILTIRDITTRKYVETQQRQRRAITEQATRTNLTGGLAAVLAHELNQPLSAIMSYASACVNIISSMDNPPAKVAEQLAKVTVQASRAGDIIRRLREFFQNSSIEVSNVDVRELINESIMLLEDELTNAQIDVEVSLSQNLIAAIDRIQIEQVLINLIKNSIEALKETPKDNKKIRLTATQSLRGDIEIVVSDSGPGIAPEIVDQLFSPFVTTRLSGMGLGLTISRSIVEAHNGRLWAELQSSSGAAMHFTIPMFNEGQ